MARPDREEMPATLNEMMGRKGELQSLEDLPDVLGEKMPEIQFNQIGRMRLLQALRNRFGEDFRNLPGVSKVLDEFDQEMRIVKLTKKRRR